MSKCFCALGCGEFSNKIALANHFDNEHGANERPKPTQAKLNEYAEITSSILTKSTLGTPTNIPFIQSLIRTYYGDDISEERILRYWREYNGN